MRASVPPTRGLPCGSRPGRGLGNLSIIKGPWRLGQTTRSALVHARPRKTASADAGGDPQAAAATEAGQGDVQPAAAKRKGRPKTSAVGSEEEGGGDSAKPLGTAAMGKRSGRISAVQQAQKEKEWAAMAAAAGAGAGPMPYAQLSQTGNVQQQKQQKQQQQQQAPAPVEAQAAPAAGGGGVVEEDARRFPLHRRLMAAAAAGDYLLAEQELQNMTAAGFEPGPRAWHTLLMAYLKGGDREGALEVAARASDASVALLADSYSALVYAFVTQDPPQAELAEGLVRAMEGAGQDPTPAWSTLVTQLTVAGLHEEAVAQMQDGMTALRLVPTEAAAQAYIVSLCKLEQPATASDFFRDGMGGFTPAVVTSRYFNPLVAAYAAAGDAEMAQTWIADAGSQGWRRDAATYNGLLAGLVGYMSGDPEDDYTARFIGVRGDMLSASVRPDATTWRWLVEGQVKCGEASAAMAALRSLRSISATKGTQLLSAECLAAFTALLVEQGRPVDLLSLLLALSEDRTRLPPQALEQDGEGRTFLSRWVVGALEGMRARTVAAEQEAATMSDISIRYVDGVAVGVGNCAVDEVGLPLPLTKMKVGDLRAECAARGVEGVEDMRRSDLAELVKAARARIPRPALAAARAAAAKGTLVGGASTAAATISTKGAAAPSKRSNKDKGSDYMTIYEYSRGRVATVREEYVTLEEPLGMLRIEQKDADQAAATPEEYAWSSNLAKNTSGIDYELLMQERYLDEGTAAILAVGDEDVVAGTAQLLGEGADDAADEVDDDDADEEAAGASGSAVTSAGAGGRSSSKRSWDAMDQFREGYVLLAALEEGGLDAATANRNAGMGVALDMIRAVDFLGAAPSPVDLVTLAAGAEAERSPEAALVVAQHLAAALRPQPLPAPPAAARGGSPAAPELPAPAPMDPDAALGLYERMARLCLEEGEVEQADEVVAAAEGVGLDPPSALLADLRAALKGRPRRNEAADRRAAALVEGMNLGQAGALEEDADLATQATAAAAASAGEAGSEEAAPGDGPPAVEAVEAEVVGVEDTPADALAAPAAAAVQAEEEGEAVPYEGLAEFQKELAAMYDSLAEVTEDPTTNQRVAREVMFSEAALGQYQHLGGALFDLRAQGGEVEAQCAAMAADLRAHVEEEQEGVWEPWQEELLEALEEDVLGPDPGDEALVEELSQRWTAATGLPWALPHPDTDEVATLLQDNPNWQQQALEYAQQLRSAPPALDPEVWPDRGQEAAAAGAKEEEVAAAAAAWQAEVAAEAAEQEDLVQQMATAWTTGELPPLQWDSGVPEADQAAMLADYQELLEGITIDSDTCERLGLDQAELTELVAQWQQLAAAGAAARAGAGSGGSSRKQLTGGGEP